MTLIDRAEDAPASGLADRVITADVFDEARVSEVFREADCVFPAIEDTEVLKQIGRYCRKAGKGISLTKKPIIISSSKQRSNQMMRELGVPVPGDFPQCGYPVICKPDASSGSRGVLLIRTEEEFRRLPERDVKHAVIQQYLSGPVYSLEVLGNGRETIVPMITEVVVDRGYDCKRIVAPAALEDERAEEFRAIAEKINSRLHNRGLFDIEAILHDGRWYVLEIDARFPSQTPISVFCSSGINYVEFLAGSAGAGGCGKSGSCGCAVLHLPADQGGRRQRGGMRRAYHVGRGKTAAVTRLLRGRRDD